MTTTGVVGRRWRATVTAWGAVRPWGDDDPLEWHVAADDRWHSPINEASVRQTRVDGTPVVETRVRVPSGDAVQRVYTVADFGGLTLVQVTNESPLPIAVAFNRGDLRTSRAPVAGPPPGIDLPPNSIVLPIGHQASVTVALAHDGSGAGPLASPLPSSEQVTRAWVSTTERAGRYVLPDAGLQAAVTAARCELALCGPENLHGDALGFLIAVGQLVRMGEPAEPWVPEVAAAIELVTGRGVELGWRWSAALDAAAVVLSAAGEHRALRDLAVVRQRTAGESGAAARAGLSADAPPAGLDLLAWIDIVFASSTAELLPLGLPRAWLGANIEAHGVPVAVGGGTAEPPPAKRPRRSGSSPDQHQPGSVSLALRWHGERPAVLWETSGSITPLTAPAMAPGWSTADAAGEALWPAPAAPSVPPGATLDHGGAASVSFT